MVELRMQILAALGFAGLSAGTATACGGEVENGAPEGNAANGTGGTSSTAAGTDGGVGGTAQE